ncbi:MULTISPECIES: hypothetical protein [Kordiimonas]|uniref:hypothetical protein n=1 Tax=Kordiimonas TaxID=288021 RepID=UPI0025805F0C|nr:hypothetical protein [Kordiimonas sp. UBA4487]
MKTSAKKAFTIAVLFTAGGCLSACGAAAITSGANLVQANVEGEYMTLAEQGDAFAQYKVGKANCCMGVGFDTQKATEWLCKAAWQNEPNAQYELARIYNGDVSRMPAPGQKLIKAFSAKKSEAHALVWATLATEQGVEGAHKLQTKIAKHIEPDLLESVNAMLSDWQGMACEYDAVFSAPEQQS